MEKLPQEIFDQIAELLFDHDTMQDFTTASRLSAGFFRACSKLKEPWHEWESITLRPGKLDTFVALYRSFRRPMLKKADYQLEIPEGFDIDSGEPDALNELVTDQISRLFRALKTLEDEGLMRRWICVGIQEPEKPDGAADDAGPRLVHLVRPEELPVVKCLWRLRMYGWNRFALRAPFELLPKLPNLERLVAHVDDSHRCEADLERRRIAERDDLAALLPGLPPPTHLERAGLSFYGYEAHKKMDHRARMPDLVGSAPADPFSLALGAWCRNLTQLRIHAVLDESFFWPEEGEGVLWPNMELLEVRFHPAAPSGSWYFQGPRGEGRDDNSWWLPREDADDEEEAEEHEECMPSQWRTDPVPEVLHPFLSAYARSARCMPRLRAAMMWSPIHWEPSERDDYDVVDGVDFMHHQMNHGDVGWGIGYWAPGTRVTRHMWTGKRDFRGDVREFWWSLAFDGLPDEVRGEIHKIGREEHGEQLVDHECNFGDQEPRWFSLFGPDDDI